MKASAIRKQLSEMTADPPFWMITSIGNAERHARKDLIAARKRSDAAQSDGTYWARESVVATASALYAFFYALGRGRKEFSPLPGTGGKMLMDYQADMTEWAQQLMSDHRHKWEMCRHGMKGNPFHIKPGKSNPVCARTGKRANINLTHKVCGKCGIDWSAPIEVE